MTALDDKLIPKAKTLCEKYGKSMVYTYLTTNTYDPTDGDVTQVEATSTVKSTPPMDYTEMYPDGGIEDQEMLVTFLPAENLVFTPAKAQKVTFDSEDWRIVKIKRHYTGESVALYELHLRK